MISRYRLSLHVSYMLVVADFFTNLLRQADEGNDFCIYLPADASPRGGRDWLLMGMYILQESAMSAMLEAHRALAM